MSRTTNRKTKLTALTKLGFTCYRDAQGTPFVLLKGTIGGNRTEYRISKRESLAKILDAIDTYRIFG